MYNQMLNMLQMMTNESYTLLQSWGAVQYNGKYKSSKTYTRECDKSSIQYISHYISPIPLEWKV